MSFDNNINKIPKVQYHVFVQCIAASICFDRLHFKSCKTHVFGSFPLRTTTWTDEGADGNKFMQYHWHHCLIDNLALHCHTIGVFVGNNIEETKEWHWQWVLCCFVFNIQLVIFCVSLVLTPLLMFYFNDVCGKEVVSMCFFGVKNNFSDMKNVEFNFIWYELRRVHFVLWTVNFFKFDDFSIWTGTASNINA